MTGTIHHDLANWLNDATKDLPPDAVQKSRAEIIAHYEDAVAEYIEAGQTEAQAHTQAMRDLGAADLTAGSLSDVYRGQIHYKLAALACMVTLFLTFGYGFTVPFFRNTLAVDSSIAYLVTDIVSHTLTIYILITLKRLLIWRFNIANLNRLFNIIIVGIIAELLYFTLGDVLLTFNHPLTTLVGFIRALLTCAGLIGLTRQLFSQQVDLYGLARALGFLAALLAVSFFSGATVRALDILPEVYSLAMALVMVTHVLIWPLLTLVFFRAVYRSPVHPARFA
jgi:hypothetical protein